MANTTIVFGLMLGLLGPIGYFAANATSPGLTPFIPSAVGVLLLFFGFLAKKENIRMHAMHGAVLVGLLGFFASAGRVAMVLANPVIKSRLALTMSCAMAVLCGVFVFLCVRSFIAARRARQAKQG